MFAPLLEFPAPPRARVEPDVQDIISIGEGAIGAATGTIADENAIARDDRGECGRDGRALEIGQYTVAGCVRTVANNEDRNLLVG